MGSQNMKTSAPDPEDTFKVTLKHLELYPWTIPIPTIFSDKSRVKLGDCEVKHALLEKGMSKLEANGNQDKHAFITLHNSRSRGPEIGVEEVPCLKPNSIVYSTQDNTILTAVEHCMAQGLFPADFKVGVQAYCTDYARCFTMAVCHLGLLSPNPAP